MEFLDRVTVRQLNSLIQLPPELRFLRRNDGILMVGDVLGLQIWRGRE
jgi:hypothetical protein